MNPRPRLVGVDYGTRRVGLAMTDPLRLFTQPIGTFPPDEAVARLRELHAREALAAVVVGWPVLEDGTEGAAVERVRPFVNRLRKALRGVEVVVQDERSTSRRATEALVAAGVGKHARREKGRVDAAAAALILQDYLDDHPEP